MEKILDKWFSYKDQSIVLSVQNKNSFDYTIKKFTMEKTLGDFIQIITYAATPYPKVFITFDYIASSIAGILGPTAILDDGTGTGARRFVFRRLFVTTKFVEHRGLSSLGWCGAALTHLVTNRFGKINNISKRLKFMSNLELKNKLKSVGIKITKNLRGKRKYLTRKELENKALLFNKLQNTAKRIKIKIMYKSRNGMYKYKTYKRLQKEINSKYQKPAVRNFNFG